MRARFVTCVVASAVTLVFVGCTDSPTEPVAVASPDAVLTAEALSGVSDAITDAADRILAAYPDDAQYAQLRAALHGVIAAAANGDLGATDGSLDRAMRALAIARAQLEESDNIGLELDAVELALGGSQRVLSEARARRAELAAR